MAKHHRYSFRTIMYHRALCVAFLLVSVFIASTATTNITNASPVIGFNPGRIIDDFVFTNSTSMNTNDIQAFLNSKVSTCDTNGTQIASEYGSSLTHARYAASKGWSSPPYRCLKDYSENGISSAQIIYNTAQQYQINPQVFIVLLQKEQSLVTDTWPLASQYKTATGYGCPDTAPCDSQYYGLVNQLKWSGTMFRAIMNNSSTWYTPYILGNNTVYYNPGPYDYANNKYYGNKYDIYGNSIRDITYCGSTTVGIQNRATQALYNYTPYQPNQASLDAGYGSAGICGAYGNRNFFLYFTDWFGTTYAYIQNGISYTSVFDFDFYINRYPDVKALFGTNPIAAFNHFYYFGIGEGRQGSAEFDINSYRNRYPDLRVAYGSNYLAYYQHYITTGKAEGRVATGQASLVPITSYRGINYSPIYDYRTYISNYADIRQRYLNDDVGALQHFVTQGMSEGRQASDEFNQLSYKSAYVDLRRAFGDNDPKSYYLHYLFTGKSEGRVGNSSYLSGTATLNGFDFSSVYSFNDYEKNNPDIKSFFGLNDTGALRHFVDYGMSEGRQANLSTFDVYVYKARYADLRAAFGNDLKRYYMHYITNGKAEGRTGI